MTRGKLKDYSTSVLFLLPNLLGFLAFTFGPVLASLVLSFCDWDILTPAKFAGFSNFVDLLGFEQTPEGWEANDPHFWQYIVEHSILHVLYPGEHGAVSHHGHSF